jgi:hypothetical protein
MNACIYRIGMERGPVRRPASALPLAIAAAARVARALGTQLEPRPAGAQPHNTPCSVGRRQARGTAAATRDLGSVALPCPVGELAPHLGRPAGGSVVGEVWHSRRRSGLGHTCPRSRLPVVNAGQIGGARLPAPPPPPSAAGLTGSEGPLRSWIAPSLAPGCDARPRRMTDDAVTCAAAARQAARTGLDA